MAETVANDNQYTLRCWAANMMAATVGVTRSIQSFADTFTEQLDRNMRAEVPMDFLAGQQPMDT